MGFWENFEFWRDPMAVAVISSLGLAYLGVWVVLKKVVYVPLALSQVSALGVVASFLVVDWLDCHEGNGCLVARLLNPAWVSISFAVAASLYFARPGRDSSKQVVVSYLLSGALVLLLGGFLRQDLHDVDSVLFGSAVLVETEQIYYVLAGAMVVGAAHIVLYRWFLFVSFDPLTAAASGVPVYRVEILIYATFAVMISLATRAMGALPAFGFCILPALAGLSLGRSMKSAFIISTVSAVSAASMGYYLSFSFELPAGASMVSVAGAIYLAAAALERLRSA